MYKYSVPCPLGVVTKVKPSRFTVLSANAVGVWRLAENIIDNPMTKAEAHNAPLSLLLFCVMVSVSRCTRRIGFNVSIPKGSNAVVVVIPRYCNKFLLSCVHDVYDT